MSFHDDETGFGSNTDKPKGRTGNGKKLAKPKVRKTIILPVSYPVRTSLPFIPGTVGVHQAHNGKFYVAGKVTCMGFDCSAMPASFNPTDIRSEADAVATALNSVKRTIATPAPTAATAKSVTRKPRATKKKAA